MFRNGQMWNPQVHDEREVVKLTLSHSQSAPWPVGFIKRLLSLINLRYLTWGQGDIAQGL